MEDYLIEEKHAIMAINRISQIIAQTLEEKFFEIDNKIINEIIALNLAIQMIAYCMRIRHNAYYNKIDEKYSDNFDYESVIFENL